MQEKQKKTSVIEAYSLRMLNGESPILHAIDHLNKDKMELSGKVEGDGIGSDIERSARVIAILEAARNRRAGSAFDDDNSEMGAIAGATD